MLTPSFIAPNLLFILFIPSVIATMFFLMSPSTILVEWSLLSISSHQFKLTFLIDPPSMIFASTIFLIASSVLKFSTSYMHSDPFLQRFTILVILFVLSMFFLIFIPNLIFLLLGWDGLGITSFLLVIYFQTPNALGAGMITALMNRLGDAFLLISIALLLNQGHWLNLFSTPSSLSSCTILCLTLAAMTKSAQIPFSSWLPAAMAAPTPVSALVHSSTLVTAGVFLLYRFYPFLSTNPLFRPALLFIAALTMLMAGLSAMVESDLKKIIALSTLSQLGVMLSTLGLGLQTLTFFHLITHALFKALLFVCAGSMIHHFSHSQDLRTLSNSSSQTPMSSSAMLIASLALAGSPFLSGFYSKDLILEMLMFNPMNMLIFFVFALATLLTAAYSSRLALALLWSPSSHGPLHNTHDEDPNLTTPMFILSLAAISSGSIMNWAFISPIPHPSLPFHWKVLPLLLCLLGAYSTWAFLAPTSPPLQIPQPMHQTFTQMWFLTPLTSQNILPSPLSLSSSATHALDHSWLEYMLSTGWPTSSQFISKLIQHPQSSVTNAQLTAACLLLMPLLLL